MSRKCPHCGRCIDMSYRRGMKRSVGGWSLDRGAHRLTPYRSEKNGTGAVDWRERWFSMFGVKPLGE